MLIHGVVADEGAPSSLRSEMARMLAGASPTPWSHHGVSVVAGRGPATALAVQAGRHVDAQVHEASDLGLLVVADLELHEAQTLARRLGCDSGDTSVTRLLALAVARWGSAALEGLRGEGTVAVWDVQRQRLTLWRDPAGSRPLYYHHRRGRHLAFSSDLRSLIAGGRLPHRLDLPYARALLQDPTFQHPERTLVADVRKVPAAGILEADLTAGQVRRYWRPWEVGTDPLRSPESHANEVRQLVEDAVARRSGASQKLGAHLSGGLDSSSLTVLAAAAQPTIAYSWSPPYSRVEPLEDDERTLVEAAAGVAGVDVRYTDLEVADVLEVMDRDVTLRATSTVHHEVAVHRLAGADGVDRIISGWGGDETVVFNGRGLFADLARHGRLRAVQREFRHRQRLLGGSVLGMWRGRVLLPLLPDPFARSGQRDKGLDALRSVLLPDLVEALRRVEPLASPALRERPGTHRMQRHLLSLGHLTYRMESWAAQGVNSGIRYRYPLLDRDVVELAFRLPAQLFFHEGWKRYIYRLAMDADLPRSVCWHLHKDEYAVDRHGSEIRHAAGQRLRERLRSRSENAFLDVSAYLDDNRPRDLRAANAAWLAFTDATLG